MWLGLSVTCDWLLLRSGLMCPLPRLQEGLPYSVHVFLAERFTCDSTLLYQASGVQFVRQAESTRPVDHVSDVSESLHSGGLVQSLQLADAFSVGPYRVEILGGNDQRRFEIQNGTYAQPVAPVTPAPPSVQLGGETVLLCPNSTNHTVRLIPTVAPGRWADMNVSSPLSWSSCGEFPPGHLHLHL